MPFTTIQCSARWWCIQMFSSARIDDDALDSSARRCRWSHTSPRGEDLAVAGGLVAAAALRAATICLTFRPVLRATSMARRGFRRSPHRPGQRRPPCAVLRTRVLRLFEEHVARATLRWRPRRSARASHAYIRPAGRHGAMTQPAMPKPRRPTASFHHRVVDEPDGWTGRWSCPHGNKPAIHMNPPSQAATAGLGHGRLSRAAAFSQTPPEL